MLFAKFVKVFYHQSVLLYGIRSLFHKKQVDVVQLKKPGTMQLANSSEIKLLTNYMYYIGFWLCNNT